MLDAVRIALFPTFEDKAERTLFALKDDWTHPSRLRRHHADDSHEFMCELQRRGWAECCPVPRGGRGIDLWHPDFFKSGYWRRTPEGKGWLARRLAARGELE